MRWIAPLFFCGKSFLGVTPFFRGRASALTPKHHFPTRTNVLAAAVVSSGLAASLDDSTTTNDSGMTGTGYLNAIDAAALDEELMSTPGFSLEQLMELAGLAVAEAIYQGVPPNNDAAPRKILLVCGPGNNGGDGLVAARHLRFFGNYECTIVYPKRSRKQHFINLVQQCEDVGIDFLDEMPPQIESYDAIVDAIFGFSFKGEPREPFGTILRQLQQAQEESDNDQQIIFSVDVPSGWNVDEGDVAQTGFLPDVLISLTAPKLCSKEFRGRHFIGGRFLPPRIGDKYKIQMPSYPGVSQVMEVTRKDIEGESSIASTSAAAAVADDSWRDEYAAYLAEKEKATQEMADTNGSPSNAKDNKEIENTVEPTWEEEYAAYCAEKEARLAKEDAKQREALQQESDS